MQMLSGDLVFLLNMLLLNKFAAATKGTGPEDLLKSSMPG